jgi:hypothetical protein
MCIVVVDQTTPAGPKAVSAVGEPQRGQRGAFVGFVCPQL